VGSAPVAAQPAARSSVETVETAVSAAVTENDQIELVGLHILAYLSREISFVLFMLQHEPLAHAPFTKTIVELREKAFILDARFLRFRTRCCLRRRIL
jgi:hypothetical protein